MRPIFIFIHLVRVHTDWTRHPCPPPLLLSFSGVVNLPTRPSMRQSTHISMPIPFVNTTDAPDLQRRGDTVGGKKASAALLSFLCPIPAASLKVLEANSGFWALWVGPRMPAHGRQAGRFPISFFSFFSPPTGNRTQLTNSMRTCARNHPISAYSKKIIAIWVYELCCFLSVHPQRSTCACLFLVLWGLSPACL